MLASQRPANLCHHAARTRSTVDILTCSLTFPLLCCFLRGPQKSDLLELLTQIRQGKLSSSICVRLERLQTAISSACIEHLDFLNTAGLTITDWESAAVTECKNTTEIGHYKSLTDIVKAPLLSDDIDYHHHVCQNRSSFRYSNCVFS